jgi:hypothetical protein
VFQAYLSGADYPAIELIIADKRQRRRENPCILLSKQQRDPRVKIVHWPHPYNYSAINNFAAAQAGGPYLCLA